jgi:hypothetical protein
VEELIGRVSESARRGGVDERRPAALVHRQDGIYRALEDLMKERVLALKGLDCNGRVVRHSTTRFLMIPT